MNKKGYLESKDRKTVLLLCDDIRMHSGIATMAREIVFGTVHHYNWINLGAAIKHPDEGKSLDLSNSVEEKTGVKGANVKVYPCSGYGNAQLLRQLLAQNKVDAIFIFTDPRYWTWLFDIEREIRQKIPLMYLNIWDNYPAPLYNRDFYDSCDLLMGISKQTVNINNIVLGDKAKTKKIKYVPHGINENEFYKISTKSDKHSKNIDKYLDFRKTIFDGKDDIEFVVFFNSRNIRRKQAPDLIAAYRVFCDSIGKEASKKCALILHTTPVDTNGTDLRRVKEAMCDPSYINIYFSAQKLTTEQMNWMYNLADLTVLPSSNEGWGLSLTESMMAETMIAANVTGGMQDQMRYEPNADVPSNHRGTYKEHGAWAVPIFPSNISLVGSVPTPYIFDDRCNFEDIALAIEKVYKLSPDERAENGVKAREWVTSEESNMSGTNMSSNVIASIDETVNNFKPRSKFDLVKVEKLKPNYVEHKLLY